ncbi:PREDICTED: probable G-protein coupled receptor 132 [Charadrius vociferus]|uniref:probable G-protein coupled receptor 132 n=1 Tax=Charadrius vociferus TaxID=50402 RepID=UPI0005217E9B|nr:PREDICTED: probable G-protein coupled receptor 132 [Charadrius vociferus]
MACDSATSLPRLWPSPLRVSCIHLLRFTLEGEVSKTSLWCAGVQQLSHRSDGSDSRTSPYVALWQEILAQLAQRPLPANPHEHVSVRAEYGLPQGEVEGSRRETPARKRMMENCTGINNNSSCSEIPYSESKRLLIAVYSIVFAVGLPANCLTSLLTFVQIQRKRVIAVYIFSLSLCELMYLSTLPLWIIYVQNEHRWNMSENACKITGFIFFCNIYISILLLCCISVDRYVALVYALESRGRRGQKKAIIIVCLLFAVVAIIHTPVFHVDSSQNGTNMATCFETLPLNITLASFSFARFLLGFAVPFAVLIFTNYKIFQSTKTSSSLTCSQKAKVKYLSIAIIVIFLICFAPYHVVLIIRSIYFMFHQDCSCPFERDIYSVFTVFLCLATANSVADPIIYVLASENVRKDFYRSLRRWRLNSSRLNSSINNKTESTKLKTLKSQEGRLRKENKEIPDSSDIQKTCSSGKDQEGGS